MAISIYPKKDLENKIEQEANKEDRTISNFILHVVKKYFKDKESENN